MNPAIFYHPDGYETTGPKLMGRHAAGKSFLRAFLEQADNDTFFCLTESSEHAGMFANAVRDAGRSEPVVRLSGLSMARFADAGVIYFPAPPIAPFASQRSLFGHGAWSLCGVTHTLVSETAMDAVTDLLAAPIQPWDALICTSRSGRSVVENLLRGQAEYLKARLGATRFVTPQLPVIPLGLHSADFDFSEADRAAARTVIGAGPDDVVVLFMGRLSFQAKAHPLAMYQALQAARQSAKGEVILVECGIHLSEQSREAFEAAARIACPAIRTIQLDGRDADAPRHAWAGADVFCSLADSLQETFGLTPIEAMAAGLPVVVTDWDGYRETVRHGIDGFRIGTAMPARDPVGDIAARHALKQDSYDLMCAKTAMQVSVDVMQAAQAFARLFANPDLRRTMGEAGRAHARATYDWSVVMPQYKALWAELGQIRAVEAPKLPDAAQGWPARPDPFSAFAAWPTLRTTAATRFVLNGEPARIRTGYANLRGLMLVEFPGAELPPESDVALVIEALASGPLSAGEIAGLLPRPNQRTVLRLLGHLAKLAVIRALPPEAPAP